MACRVLRNNIYTIKMHSRLIILCWGILPLFLCGCVSAWMTNATGKKIYFQTGMPRTDVVKTLGAPKERKTEINAALRNHLSYLHKAIAYVEIYEFKGKINTVDEGGGQAIMNALTLGTAEVIMIPMTAADIVVRSLETNLIYVFYDDSDLVVDFMINPPRKYQTDQASEPSPASSPAGH